MGHLLRTSNMEVITIEPSSLLGACSNIHVFNLAFLYSPSTLAQFFKIICCYYLNIIKIELINNGDMIIDKTNISFIIIFLIKILVLIK